MALPKISVLKYKLKLPSDGRTVNFRPFLVKEEKILLLATESGEQATIVEAIKDIIKDCTDITDVDKLATFDIEFVFLQIRTKSVGESVDVTVTCPDDEETQVPVMIDLDDIQVEKSEEHSNKIKLDTNLMMEMRYPSLEQFIKSNFDFDDKNQMDQSFALIASCIDKIYSEDEVWATADCTKKEMNDFLESMNSSQFKEIEKFFETMPKLKHEIKITNPKTGVESDVVLEGLASFFA